jgi:hypothetical protein
LSVTLVSSVWVDLPTSETFGDTLFSLEVLAFVLAINSLISDNKPKDDIPVAVKQMQNK